LGEIPKQSGTVNVYGSAAYVAQQAWVQNATLKDNILFGKPYNQKKYSEATDVCELTADISVSQ
jgi:ATP-binding cassette subfamily C (CFTR/MRP) protein 1